MRGVSRRSRSRGAEEGWPQGRCEEGDDQDRRQAESSRRGREKASQESRKEGDQESCQERGGKKEAGVMDVAPWHLRTAVEALTFGGVIAYPTEAVWGLSCSPRDERAGMRLLALTHRHGEKGMILETG